MPHPFVYTELHTTAPEPAKAFYRELFAWDMTDIPTPAGAYTGIAPGDGPGAGLMGAAPQDDGRSHWLPYVQVPALEVATARAVELGARLLAGKTEVPGQGWFTWLVDPTGARFALWEKQAAAE
jgi:predicted enzyme related to lactoylglutathione lyase